MDPFFRNFSDWTEPIHWVLDRNFRKVWLNGSRPQCDNFLPRTLLNNVPFPPTSMRSCLGRLFRSYYIRLRMCAATASIDRIELHASLTNWMWDSRNRFVSSWQFRCFLGLITSKSAAIAFTGLSTQTSGGKLNLDRLLAYGRKINRQILNPERNLRIKRERMEVSLQFVKLAVNVPNAKFIYIAGGDFCFYYCHRR